jgi:beta-lactam-binding protein with PASTA domain
VAETDPVTASQTAGQIVEEDPAAGSQAQVGSVIRLNVAVGVSRPARQVPDVVGRKAAEARATLLAAKLTVRTQYKRGPSSRFGVVLGETPTGTTPAYTQITIVVGA